MKKILATALLAALSCASQAAIINGGFEDGLNGWNTVGSAGTTTEDAGYTATQGSSFANLTAYGTLSQTLSWAAGEVLSFDWNFNGEDYMPYNDWSVFEVKDSGDNVLSSFTLANIGSLGDYNATGWQNFSFTFANAGTGSINFGVFNALDNGLSSKLYVDNVKTTSVPEPTVFGLLATGLIALGLRRKAAK